MKDISDSLHSILFNLGSKKLKEITDFIKHIEKKESRGAAQKEMELEHFKFIKFIEDELKDLPDLNLKFLRMVLNKDN